MGVEVAVEVVSGCTCETSSTVSRMKRMRCEFILCKRANSPRSSHHSTDSERDRREEKMAVMPGIQMRVASWLGRMCALRPQLCHLVKVNGTLNRHNHDGTKDGVQCVPKLEETTT